MNSNKMDGNRSYDLHERDREGNAKILKKIFDDDLFTPNLLGSLSDGRVSISISQCNQCTSTDDPRHSRPGYCVVLDFVDYDECYLIFDLASIIFESDNACDFEPGGMAAFFRQQADLIDID